MPEPIDTSKLGPIRMDANRPTVDLMISKLDSCKGPDHYSADINVFEANTIGQKMRSMRDAMQEFVDRVDKGEVRSKRTYAKFKEILG